MSITASKGSKLCCTKSDPVCEALTHFAVVTHVKSALVIKKKTNMAAIEMKVHP